MATSYYIGYLAKTHGYKGNILIKLDTPLTEELNIEEPIFLEINQRLVPFFMEELTQNPDSLIVKLEDIDSDETARTYLGSKIYLELDIAEDAEVTLAVVIGFTVIDTNLGKLGTITDFIKNKDNNLLEMDYKGKEIYIPANLDIINEIVADRQEILVTLPTGLLDIYLDEDWYTFSTTWVNAQPP